MEHPKKVTCPVCGRTLSVDCRECPGCGCNDAGESSQEYRAYEAEMKAETQRKFKEAFESSTRWIQALGEKRFIWGKVCWSCQQSFWYRLFGGRHCLEIVSAKPHGLDAWITLRCSRCGSEHTEKMSDLKRMMRSDEQEPRE